MSVTLRNSLYTLIRIKFLAKERVVLKIECGICQAANTADEETGHFSPTLCEKSLILLSSLSSVLFVFPIYLSRKSIWTLFSPSGQLFCHQIRWYTVYKLHSALPRLNKMYYSFFFFFTAKHKETQGVTSTPSDRNHIMAKTVITKEKKSCSALTGQLDNVKGLTAWKIESDYSYCHCVLGSNSSLPMKCSSTITEMHLEVNNTNGWIFSIVRLAGILEVSVD